MNASSLKPDAKPSRPAESASVSEWLDAVAAGACTQKEFLSRVEALEADDPEAPWEVLSLLDQYLRREIITRDVHVSLKARLQQRYMGFGGDSGDSPALEQTDVHTFSPREPARAVPAVPSADGSAQIGDVLRGRYQLVDVLRKEPPGVQFEAIDQFKVAVPHISHRVAIELFDEAAQRDQGLLQRICAIQSLAHPCIERVFEVDEDRGALLLVTETLNGASLQQLGEQGGALLTLAASQTIVQGIASALAYAHSHNVFHGDVCAANVFITDVGEVRLRGFETRARDVPANPKGDRLAFAWFAYELLSSLRHSWSGDRNSQLRQPPGVTREQWRVLRGALRGKDGGASNVLAAFAGANNPGPVVLRRDGQRTRARRMGVTDWMAIGVVAAVLVAAGFFLVTRGVLIRRGEMQPATVEPVPQAATANAAAVVPADVAVEAVPPAAPSVAPAPVPVPSAPAAPAPVPSDAASAEPAPAEPAVSETAPVARAKPAAVPRRPSPAQIDLPSATQTVAGDEPVAKIQVRRRGGLTGEISFRWWTESGSARVDQDFRAITPRVATIANGARGVELLVPLVANPSRRQPRTFYVKIDEPGSGATLGDQTLMQVSIVPPGYVEAPAER